MLAGATETNLLRCVTGELERQHAGSGRIVSLLAAARAGGTDIEMGDRMGVRGLSE
ncbi:hypothetical protein GCM10010399_09230 [Dactylosporangium fulvum]